MKMSAFLGFAIVPVLISSLDTAEAAVVLTGSVNHTPGPADLTAQGDLDWAIWNVTSPTSSPFGTGSREPTNRMSGGTGQIGDITAVGTNTTWRGSGGTSIGTQTFSYTNGTSPSSLANTAQSLVFNSSLDSIGQGVSLTVSGTPGQLTTVYVWGTGYQGQGTLTASLAGASNLELLSQTYGTGKNPTLFQINFTPEDASDLLILTYALTTDATGGNSHVGIQAVAVSAIPEPSTGLVALLGTGLAVFRRRRR